MSAAAEKPVQATPKQAPVRLYRVTLDVFDRMIAAGVIENESRVELLDGVLVELEAMNPPHFNRIKRLYDHLLLLLAGRADVYAQSSIELPNDGRPQPDVFLVKPGGSEHQFAGPADVLLLIEVSESTLDKDRGFKSALYARDGIQEYWIVNLVDNQLEVHRDPDGDRYATTFTVKAGQAQSCLAFPEDPIDWS